MNTPVALRKRQSTVDVVTPGLLRILAGVFGVGKPDSHLSDPKAVAGRQGLYHFHEGDIFEPGTGNWVFDPPYENPLMTVWGNAFLRTPNTFNPSQPPQIYTNPNVTINGLGGLMAGQIALQGLIDPTAPQDPETGA